MFPRFSVTNVLLIWQIDPPQYGANQHAMVSFSSWCDNFDLEIQYELKLNYDPQSVVSLTQRQAAKHIFPIEYWSATVAVSN